MKLSILALASVLMTLVSASSSLESSELISKRASFPVPASKGKVTFKAPQVIAKGKTYDGGLKTYGRGVSCSGQSESLAFQGGDKDAVFQLEDGATLKNAIIGVDQIEGVHCMGSCTIENVWWTDVCEDALTIKGDGNAFVYGGGAQHAEDKVVQHNGQGTVTIDGFTVSDFGKLYRSCGNCKPKNGVTKPKRTVVIKNVKADSGKVLVGINSNFGDTATVTGTCATSVKTICQEFEGNTNQKEPPKIGKGEPSKACKFTAPLPKC